jgi:hypothetical protein
MGTIFGSCAYRMSIENAINLGWLVPIRSEMIEIQKVDFSKVRTKLNQFGENDFNEADLGDVMAEEETSHAIAVPLLEKAGDRAGPVFCAGVQAAHVLAAVLNRLKPNCAAALDANTPAEKRRQILRDLAEGRLQFIPNCAILTEGWDSPRSSVVGMARPTNSPQLAAQMLGRVLRPLDGVVDGYPCAEDRGMAILRSDKPYALCLDYVCASRHKLVTSMDVLGGNFNLAEIERAKANARGVCDPDVLDQLKMSRAELILKTEQQRRREILADVRYRAVEVNLLGRGATPHVNMDTSAVVRGGSTDKQVAFLVKLGVRYATAAGYTRMQAGAVIDNLVRKRNEEPCSPAQRKTLTKFGENPNVNWATAKRIIDEIAGNGWRRRDVTEIKPDGVASDDFTVAESNDGTDVDGGEFGNYCW